MSEPESESSAYPRSRTTLALSTVLHAFTHAYSTMLVPLYLLMVHDMNLNGAAAASLIVTVYGLVYCLGSYGAGVLADRMDRKRLLGVGLIGNAAAIMLMGFTRRYEFLIALGVVAGLFGTLFHPSANALVTAHFPKSPGMAIGLLGCGAGLGFFAGPHYAGWRAEAARWEWMNLADWQRPLVELGVVGIVVGLLFLILAKDARRRRRAEHEPHPPLGVAMRRRVIALALVLGCRDFAGVASLSLVGIYLLRAHGLDARRTGFIVGAMMLVSVVVNPLFVYFSGGQRRLPTLLAMLVLGGGVVATLPLWPLSGVLPVMCIFQTFQLGSYAVSDAAVLERVPADVRGRVVGLFLLFAGTFASTGPFVMGAWSDALGGRAYNPTAYLPLFGTLGALMVIGAFSTPLIAKLGAPDEEPIESISEIRPATMEPMV
ncbi:MAG TPA: MFS transporter [Tepidisphaeraceae bacterium]|nr:MFS transporter [Tepidisphaeraceae bacterium]